MSKKKSSWAPIYKFVKSIPRGRVVTYGQLARLLHVRGGARTVGFAMAGCPSGQGIPWHRVVGAGGRLLPREPYGAKQRMLLESEGAQFSGMKVDLRAHLWEPGKARPNKKQSAGKKRASRARFAKRRTAVIKK